MQGELRWLKRPVFGTRIVTPPVARVPIPVIGGPIVPLDSEAHEGWVLCLTPSGTLFLSREVFQKATREA